MSCSATPPSSRHHPSSSRIEGARLWTVRTIGKWRCRGVLHQLGPLSAEELLILWPTHTLCSRCERVRADGWLGQREVSPPTDQWLLGAMHSSYEGLRSKTIGRPDPEAQGEQG